MILYICVLGEYDKFYGKQLVLLTFFVIKVHKNPINSLILLLPLTLVYTKKKSLLSFFYHYKIIKVFC